MDILLLLRFEYLAMRDFWPLLLFDFQKTNLKE